MHSTVKITRALYFKLCTQVVSVQVCLLSAKVKRSSSMCTFDLVCSIVDVEEDEYLFC